MSTTQSTKFIVTMGGDLPIPMQQNAKISLLLVGEGPLVRALQQALTVQIDQAVMGEIELVRELEPAYQDPVLVVKVGMPDPIWTPFFAMSEFLADYFAQEIVTALKKVQPTCDPPGQTGRRLHPCVCQ